MRLFASKFKHDFENTKETEQFHLDQSVWNRFKQDHFSSISAIFPQKIMVGFGVTHLST
jgi:hypothetical protein